MPSIEHGIGNESVIAALERLLEEARKGRIGFLICAMAATHKDHFGGYAGNIMLLQSAEQALEGVLRGLDADKHNRTPLHPDPGLDASHVCFNMCKGPLSFDFILWLVDALMTMKREGAPGPLKVCFFTGRDGKAADLDKGNRRKMFDGIVRPLLDMVGAVEDHRAERGRQKELYIPRDIMRAVRSGEKPPMFEAPHAARAEMATWLVNRVGLTPPVVITLREYIEWPHRNSNVEAWTAFARDLVHHGQPVIFVRDTDKAYAPLPGFATCPQASIDLHARMALYEQARHNFFVSNGPAGMATYSIVPFTIFIPLEEEGHPYLPSTPSFWREYNGLEPGAQLPWSHHDQRIVWAEDSYKNICAVWEEINKKELVA